jgi:hypothetical protein
VPRILRQTQSKDLRLFSTNFRFTTLEPVIHFPAIGVASENRTRRGPPHRRRPVTGEPAGEAEGFGGTKVEADNKAWPDFHPSADGAKVNNRL